MEIPKNIVVCPKCDTHFEHNKINGIALLEAVQDIEARKKMYCRLTLDAIERVKEDEKIPYPVIRKIVLDALSDFARDVHSIIGFGTEVE